ncbi:T9SS type B sorting domain-containing protein [Sediminitomix flava]|uniref:Gliding motility-associated-like protein n=1 Tax=Sediminitomix flava TaxID=379075 RepID=A0A315ZBK1_SEDFL|nr:gliding motility-associated C-terminal domain-containing protein [Sediminitomix flava]PWJ42094.1 gliding motility-associated-like protein [Sediminitomix flava]
MTLRTYRLLLCTFLFWACALPSFATHIVGGNLNLKHLNGNRYELSLIIYFDEINGNHQAIDRIVPISAFTKNHNWVETFELSLSSQTPVNYKYPECSIPEIVTTKIVYKNTITLSPTIYTDLNGYYFSFERCCRNATIVNIIEPEFNGQTFYLEFPAVNQNRTSFINSSPNFKEVENNYACVGQPFSFDFGAIDSDEDQLKYSLSVPLEGNSSPLNPLPAPQSGPYPEVTFTNGHSLAELIKGQPALSINDDTGMLSVTPSEEGLFVFAVKCEEFRDGEKIGEVRRDFQILVNECQEATPPIIESLQSNSQLWERTSEGIEIDNTENLECFSVNVLDVDSDNISLRIKESRGIDLNKISVLNFNQRVNELGYATFDVCLDGCISQNANEVAFLIEVWDESCSQPLRDEVWVNLKEQNPNNSPTIETDIILQEEKYILKALVNHESSFSLEINDLDRDSIAFAWNTSADTLNILGISPSEAFGRGLLTQTFTINPNCELFASDEFEHIFELEGIAKDIAECGVISETKINIEIHLIRPENSPMKLSSDLEYDENLDCYLLEVGSNQLKTISILGEDQDPYAISISAHQQNFSFETSGSLLGEVKGTPNQSLQLNVVGDCSILNSEDGFAPKSYFIKVKGEEYDDCGKRGETELKIKVTVIHNPTENTAPKMTLRGANTTDSLYYQKSMFIGGLADFSLQFIDQENDMLNLTIKSSDGNILSQLNLNDQIVSETTPFDFSIDALCELIPDGQTENKILLTFEIEELKNCNTALTHTIELELLISDYLSLEKPFPNAFSPNGDGKGDHFYLHHVLPTDNCQSYFEEIQIVNRWGESVYSSTDREFKWAAEEISSGTYFYIVKFSNKNFKGSVQVFK